MTEIMHIDMYLTARNVKQYEIYPSILISKYADPTTIELSEQNPLIPTSPIRQDSILCSDCKPMVISSRASIVWPVDT